LAHKSTDGKLRLALRQIEQNNRKKHDLIANVLKKRFFIVRIADLQNVKLLGNFLISIELHFAQLLVIF